MPLGPTLSRFALAAQPSIDTAQVCEFHTGRFVASGKAALLPGPPGMGKSHLASAMGRDVTIAGYTVVLIPAVTLSGAPAKAHAEGKLEDSLSQSARPGLLIVDRSAYMPFEPDIAHLSYRIFKLALQARRPADQVEPPDRGMGKRL